MKKLKLIRNVLAVLAVLATVVFISCDAFFGNEQNVTINLPPISSSARAISSDKISDLKNVTTSYRVTVNDMTREGAGGTYTFTLPVGVVAEITVECLNSSGNVIVRAKKTHTVTAGTNNVDIILSRDGDVVGTGGTPSDGGGEAPVSPTTDLKSTPVVGSIIMKDGTLCDTTSVVGREADAIAVVYKVASGKAWAVGKVLSNSTMYWAKTSAQGYGQYITDLQEENGYTDGSTGLEILRAAVTDANGDDLATNYPAWDYACNYGIKQGLTSFQTGWYLPSKQELQEVCNNKDAIEAALAQTGVSKTSFDSSYNWSSSQYASNDNYAYDLNFWSGSWSSSDKGNDFCVCAIRQFTW